MKGVISHLRDILSDCNLKLNSLKIIQKTIHNYPKFYYIIFLWSVISTVVGLFLFFQLYEKYQFEVQKSMSLSKNLEKIQSENESLKTRDEFKINEDLKKNLDETRKIYSKSLSVYEDLIDIPSSSKNLPKLRMRYANILKLLSENNYVSASALLTQIQSEISEELRTLPSFSSSGINVDNLPISSSPPGSGYSRQAVEVNGEKFVVDIIAAPLSSTHIIVDTASETDCRDNCPVLPLEQYVSRNGAFAGINGSYFCPADYPTCTGKSNSFDTLVMNKNKTYINSENNVYSTVPAVIFGNGFIRFVGATQEWGRDTSVDGVLANQGLLVFGGKSVFTGDSDPKKGTKGIRGFVASGSGNAYIGVVRNATVVETALVLEKMGMEGALNLDSGGSTALWSGGYKVGPGRNIPNAILFVAK